MDVMDNIIAEVISTMPKPSPIADEKNEQPSNAPGNVSNNAAHTGDSAGGGSAPFLRDTAGNIFDPSIHDANPDGTPKLKANGRFAKKRGRKPGSPGNATSPDPTASRRQASLQAGRATAEAIFALGQAIGGDEWRPIIAVEQGINEPQQMIEAWASYYQATGKTDVPPWVIVAIACGAYALPRTRLPKTQSRIKSFWGWLRPYLFRTKKDGKK